MKSLLIKDQRRRLLVQLYERRRRVRASLVANRALPIALRTRAYLTLQTFPRDTSVTRRRNRCVATGRPRGVLTRAFGLSRLAFRRLAWRGELPGVRKSS